MYHHIFVLGYRALRSDKFLISPLEPLCITIPASNIDYSKPFPRVYNRVKEFTKEALDAILKRRQQRRHANKEKGLNDSDLDDEPAMKAITAMGGPKYVSEALRQQLEAYWRNDPPFVLVALGFVCDAG